MLGHKIKISVLLWVAIMAVVPLSAQAATRAKGFPKTVRLPSIKTTIAVEPAALNKNNVLPGPKSAWNVTWYRYGTKPGQKGNVFLLGHLDTYHGRAALWNLRNVRVGDRVEVVNDKKQKFKYVITSRQVIPRQRVPISSLLYSTSGKTLSFVTCAGQWVRSQANYTHRLVVIAKQVSVTKIVASR